MEKDIKRERQRNRRDRKKKERERRLWDRHEASDVNLRNAMIDQRASVNW